jgi:hypothetical protein
LARSASSPVLCDGAVPAASAKAAAKNTVHDLAAATGRLPHLTSWLAYPSGPSPEEQFALGLGFLLDGIARCLAGAESPARSAHS